jgi:hypothetical protein
MRQVGTWSLRQLCVAQIILGQIFASLGRKFDRLPTIHTKLLVGHGVGERKLTITSLPCCQSIDRSGHRLARGQLQRVNATNNLEKVASRTGRVGHHEGNRSVRFDDKDATNRKRHALGVLVGLNQDSHWLSLKDTSSATVGSVTSDTQIMKPSESSYNLQAEENGSNEMLASDARTQRLIEWNVDVLRRQLKKIIAMRNVSSRKSSQKLREVMDPLHILLATNVKANEQESLRHELVGC